MPRARNERIAFSARTWRRFAASTGRGSQSAGALSLKRFRPRVAEAMSGYASGREPAAGKRLRLGDLRVRCLRRTRTTAEVKRGGRLVERFVASRKSRLPVQRATLLEEKPVAERLPMITNS